MLTVINDADLNHPLHFTRSKYNHALHSKHTKPGWRGLCWCAVGVSVARQGPSTNRHAQASLDLQLDRRTEKQGFLNQLRLYSTTLDYTAHNREP